MNEFINPKSMLTPGAAGTLVMLIANTLCFQFTELSPRFVALALSGLLGAALVSMSELKRTPMFLFGAFNSLIIFAMAMSTASFANRMTTHAASAPIAMLDILLPTASAQETTEATRPHTHTRDSSMVSTSRSDARVDSSVVAEAEASEKRIRELEKLVAEQNVRLEEARKNEAASNARAEANLRNTTATAPESNAQGAEQQSKTRFFRKW